MTGAKYLATMTPEEVENYGNDWSDADRLADLYHQETLRRIEYQSFIESKTQLGSNGGFKPNFYPSAAFDFQLSLLEWQIEKGRGAIFADCGLGKTLLELGWAENVVRHTNKPVLLLTPLAVSAQTIQEAEKFEIEAKRSRDGTFSGAGIIVTNYEQLHRFDYNDFAGVVCDESSRRGCEWPQGYWR